MYVVAHINNSLLLAPFLVSTNFFGHQLVNNFFCLLFRVGSSSGAVVYRV